MDRIGKFVNQAKSNYFKDYQEHLIFKLATCPFFNILMLKTGKKKKIRSEVLSSEFNTKALRLSRITSAAISFEKWLELDHHIFGCSSSILCYFLVNYVSWALQSLILLSSYSQTSHLSLQSLVLQSSSSSPLKLCLIRFEHDFLGRNCCASTP